MNSKMRNVINENAFLPDPKKRKNLDTSKPIDIRLKDGKERGPIYHKLPKDGVFKQYEDLEVISSYIVKELLGDQIYSPADMEKVGYKEIIDRGLTYFMSAEHGQKHAGLLSICPTLLTAMKIWQVLPSESPLRGKIYANIINGIEAMFKIIYRDGEVVLNNSAPVFDASPYETNAFTKGLEGRSYIDSISWVIPVFLRIMNMTEEKDQKKEFVFAKYRPQAEFLAKWCLEYVNGAMVSDSSGKKPMGWNFTRLENYKSAERSLYFTYAASTIYLSFYAEYEPIIEALKTLDAARRVRDEDDMSGAAVVLSETYWNNKNGEMQKALEEVLKDLDKAQRAYEAEMQGDGNGEALEYEIAERTELKEALELLLNPENAESLRAVLVFNDDKRILIEENMKEGTAEDLGAIVKLKWNLQQVAEGMWSTIKDKLEDKFFYEDINATVAESEAIENGGQTNALFTGLLQIGIVLNSAYDIKIRADKGTKEYEKMQDAMFAHVQKAQRFFDKLEDEGRSFGVDSLTLRFMERIGEGGGKEIGVSDRALAEKLRKANIKVCTLTPMLLKTNNLLSEYVIQYPQKQMGESLLRISQKRFLDKSNKDKERYRWFWEADGYHAISNYYYVGAIFDFYGYYKKYEQSYVKRYENMRQDLLRDLNFTEQVRKHYQTIADEKSEIEKAYEQKLKEKDEEILRILAEAKKSEIGEKLVSDVNQVVEESSYFDEPRFLKRIISGLRAELAAELVQRYAKTGNEDNADLEKLKKPLPAKDDSMLALLQAFAADVILPSAIEAKKLEGTGIVHELGRAGLEDILPGDFAVRGGKQLIQKGLIEKLFANMCAQLVWSNQKDK